MRRSTAAKGLGWVIVLLASVNCASAQSQIPWGEGAAQAVGLFAKACIRFGGNPTKVRQFLESQQVPKLSTEASAVFLGDRKGVGFDATNRVTRLALISEDNSLCTVFAETVNPAKIIPFLQSAADGAGLQLVANGQKERGGLTSHFYKLNIAGHPFKIVASTGNDSGRVFRAALTLAPDPQ